MDGKVDYEQRGTTYARHRRADPRIAARIHAALGDARTVVNVGAGAGSYEPADRCVLAVEPSATMRAQRPPGAAPALDARAEALPFDDDAFGAAMACITIHHWDPRDAGLRELRRVARGPVVVFTFEPGAMPEWQREHFREVLAIDEPRLGQIADVAAALGGRTRVEHVPTPSDCTDGFVEGAQSVWALVEPGVEERIVRRLAESLHSGEWDRRFGDLRGRTSIDGSLRLVISEPD